MKFTLVGILSMIFLWACDFGLQLQGNCNTEREKEIADSRRLSSKNIQPGMYQESRGVLLLKKDSNIFFRSSNLYRFTDSSGDSVIGVEYKGQWYNDSSDFVYRLDSLRYFYNSDSASFFVSPEFGFYFPTLKADVLSKSFSLSEKQFIEKLDCDYRYYTFIEYKFIGNENSPWPSTFNWNKNGTKHPRVP